MKLKYIPILLLLITVCLYFIFLFSKSNNIPLEYQLTVLFTNDLHGHIESMPEYSTLIKTIRKDKANVLLLDAGDLYARGPYEKYRGRVELEVEKAMGYDALTLGNNEFKKLKSKTFAENISFIDKNIASLENKNPTQFFQFSEWANFSILCCNVKVKSNNKSLKGVDPYIVKNLNGVKIGIIGVTTDVIKNVGIYNTKGLSVINCKTAVDKLLPEVKKRSDIQILLSHSGMYTDRKYTGVNAIIGGHDHLVTKHPVNSNGIPIMQAGGEGYNYLGRLDMMFEKVNNKWNEISYSGKLYTIDNVSEDPKIVKILNMYKK